MSAPVIASWDRIEMWLHANVPDGALHPPVDEVVLSKALRETGLRFPSDLVESLRRHDGTPMSGRTGLVVPTRWLLLPLATSLEIFAAKNAELARQQAEEVEEIVEDEDEDWSDLDEADDDVWGWNQSWLPIALDGNGCHLVVDLGGGERFGAVGVVDPQSNPRFTGTATWPSVAALLEHTADALNGGDPSWVAAVLADGRMEWNWVEPPDQPLVGLR